MKLTDKIIKKYLKNPDCCPFCNSKNITAHSDDCEFSSLNVWRGIKCKDCNREWVEQFKLELIDNLIEP